MPVINVPPYGPLRFSDSLSKEEIAQKVQRIQAKAEREAEAYKFDPREELSFGEKITGGAKRAASGLGSLVTDVAPALFGSAFGFEDYAREQMAEAAEKRRAAELESPTAYRKLGDIRGIGDVPGFVAETLGEGAVDLASLLVPGGVGSVVGRRIAQRGAAEAGEQIAKRLASREAAMEAGPQDVRALAETATRRLASTAGREGAEAGFKTGVRGGAYGLASGEIFQSVEDETGKLEPGLALVLGVPFAALDSFLPEQIAKQLGSTGKALLTKEMLEQSTLPAAKSMASRLAVSIPSLAAKEGLTESAQESISILAEQIAGSKKEFFDPENVDRMITSGLKGGIAGGMFGAPGAAVEAARGKRADQAQIDAEIARRLEAAKTPEEREQILMFGYDLKIARGRGATDEELQQLQAKIDAEQLAKQKETRLEELTAKAQGTPKKVIDTPEGKVVIPAVDPQFLSSEEQKEYASLRAEKTSATPEQKVAEAVTKVDALTSRIDELTDEYIAAGDSPDQAKIKAAAQVAEEERNDQEAEQAIQELAEVQAEAGKEAEDAAKAIEQGGGESVPIPSRPDGGVPTGRVEPPVTAGVERLAPSAETTVRREEVPSGAVEPPITPVEPSITPITPVETTKPLEETPSVTTPTETKQAKEEGAAAPAEGTEVAKPATETKPITVLKQPSSKNAAGESVKNLELSNGEKVQIIRRGKQWVREDAGEVTPVGKTLREAIANITGVVTEPITKPEILKQAQESTSSRINDAINNLRKKVNATARDAAKAVINNTRENSFENILAKRLLNLVGDVPFNVIDADHKDVKVRDKFIGEQAKGVYVRNADILGNPLPKGSVYVVGAKYGNLDQGVNNRTVLHELTHVGSAERIKQGKALLAEDKNSTDPRAAAVRKLQALMEATQREYAKLESNPDIPTAEQLKILSSERFQQMMGKEKGQGKALYDLDEFFTYAMTDPQFQAFLKTIKFGPTRTAFSDFVAAIRNLLGLNKDTESVLANIIDVSETLLPTTQTADTALQKGDLASALRELELLSQKQDVQTAADVQVKYGNDVINTPRSQGPSVSALNQAVANGMDLSSQAELAGAIAEGAMSGARKHILGAFTPSQLAKLVVEKVPALTRVVELGRKFNAKRQQYLDEMKKTMKPWLKLQRNDREQSQLLATIMHLATVNGIDPSIPAKERVASTPQSDTLDDLWEKLGEPAREIYIDVRDYYAKQYDRYKDLLEKRIQAMGISDEEKTKFMDLLKKEFEVGKVAQPYFPLMRYGENWLRVGTGKNMEFYMFESASERNRFAIRRAKEMGKPLKDLYADGTLKRGDQLTNMMEESFADTTKLKEVLAAVDKLGIDTDKASIKDEIYQMYLLTLPEKSFRKQFIHRKNTAGFSADALRNFGTAGFRMANQLAKMEYQPQIVNTLDEARESIKDDPDASKYRPYIEEVAADFDAAVNPKNENSILNFAANGLSTLNFFYYMSSISSALTNMTSLPVFGYPTLLAEFGKTPGGAKDVHKELVRFMNVYKEVGFRRKGGDKDKIEKIKNSNLSPEEKDKRIREEERKTEYVMPSIRMALTDADEIKAYDEFAADNLFSFNRSMDLLNIVKSPSQEATNPNILKVPVQKATDLVSGIFSMTEQLPREMMAMAAYRLGRSQDLSHDEATKKALVLTHDAMYDYSMFDTPRYFRGPVGRTIFQFKKFSQNTAFYLTTNFLQIFKGADPTIRKQAATRFFGTLGMTGMFAGLTGMPLYTVMSTVAEKVLSAFGDDDDDEDSAIFQIRKYGFDLWFKKWLSENFGANVATYVAMGPVTGLTGADFNARVKLNDLFFPDWEFKGLLGPSFGLYENAQRAYDRFKEGQTERAIETMMPAFIRQPLKAYRFSEEGVKTPKGYEVVAQEDLNWMDIAMQGIGYAPIRVSMKQSENYKLKKLEQERETERTELLKRAVYARRGISDEESEDIDKDIDAFNKKFPNRRITTGTIINSDQARRRQERAVDQGLYIANPLTRRELLEMRAKD